MPFGSQMKLDRQDIILPVSSIMRPQQAALGSRTKWLDAMGTEMVHRIFKISFATSSSPLTRGSAVLCTVLKRGAGLRRPGLTNSRNGSRFRAESPTGRAAQTRNKCHLLRGGRARTARMCRRWRQRIGWSGRIRAVRRHPEYTHQSEVAWASRKFEQRVESA